MNNNFFENFRIDRIIAHEIFKRDENRQVVEPEYSNELTTLEGRGLITLQDRIISSLGQGSHSLKMDVVSDGVDSTFQKAANIVDSNDDKFVNISKELTYSLARAQFSRRIPGGVVVLMDGLTGADSYKYVLIIKAEIHSGFNKTTDGQKLILEYLSDLLLTPQQKFYKIGIFIEKESSNGDEEIRSSDEFETFVYDHNIKAKDEEHKAAQYFYESFLGCAFSPTNKKLTKDFYYHTKKFINNSDVEDDQKVDLHNSLYVYLKVSQNQTIKTSDFANEYLGTDLKDRYLDYMETKEFPQNSIMKDISYLKRKLKKRRIKFTSDVQLVAPSNNFDQLVKITQTNTTKTFLEIEGVIKDQD